MKQTNASPKHSSWVYYLGTLAMLASMLLLPHLIPSWADGITPAGVSIACVFVGAIIGILTTNDLILCALFAMGGLECAFFMPLVGGAFCKWGTRQGAIASALGGCVVYVFCYYFVSIAGINAVVWGLLASIILYFVVSKATIGNGLDPDILDKCF